MTNLETREVRYYCKLCAGLDNIPAWENLATDEAVILAHIKEQHGLEPTPSVYISPEEADKNCKATSIRALTASLRARLF